MKICKEHPDPSVIIYYVYYVYVIIFMLCL